MVSNCAGDYYRKLVSLRSGVIDREKVKRGEEKGGGGGGGGNVCLKDPCMVLDSRARQRPQDSDCLTNLIGIQVFPVTKSIIAKW